MRGIEDMNALEQYINEMENRSAIDNTTNVDVWTQLQQKENDLVLAAEFGKALLEKNEDLKKQQDAIIEEYSKKLEVSPSYFQIFSLVLLNLFFSLNQNISERTKCRKRKKKRIIYGRRKESNETIKR